MAKAIDRIFSIIQSLGMSARQFDMSIGASNGYTLRMKKNNASVGSDILERIVEKYPFVNINWVVTGHGTMFVTVNFDQNGNPLGFVVFSSWQSCETLNKMITCYSEYFLSNCLMELSPDHDGKYDIFHWIMWKFH